MIIAAIATGQTRQVKRGVYFQTLFSASLPNVECQRECLMACLARDYIKLPKITFCLFLLCLQYVMVLCLAIAQ